MTEQEKIKKYREIVQRRIRAQIEVAVGLAIRDNYCRSCGRKVKWS